jgi:translocation and assembly module TamA
MRVVGMLAFAILLGGADPNEVKAQPASDDGELLPDTPMAPLPDLGLDWPDPDAPPQVEVDGDLSDLDTADPALADAPAALPAISNYRVAVEGVAGAGLGDALSAFRSFSALQQNDDDATNAAQIDRRAIEDRRLLENILVSHGYYDATVEYDISAARNGGDHILVQLRANPGARYTFEDVRLTGIAPEHEAEIRGRLKLKPGDPVDAADVLAAHAAFVLALPAAGYAFAEVAPPDIVVDRSSQRATLTLAVKTGAKAVFGDIRIEGRRIFGPRHVGLIARFEPGDAYDPADLDDLRRALIATGLVASVNLRQIPSGTTADGRTIVDIGVGLEKAPAKTIAGSIGYGTGEGARAEISWQHRNLLKPEGAVTFRAVAGTREQLLAADIKRSNWLRRDQVLLGRVAAQHQNLDAYDARTVTVAGSVERQTNIIWQKKWTYSLGLELLASSERDTDVSLDVSRRRTFFIGAVPGRLAYDGSDDLLDPRRGFRLSARLSPEVSLQGSAFTYARAQIDASAYLPLGSEKYVLAGRVRAGSIIGAARDRIAPSRRFYAGGGGSVRGFGYQRIGPVDSSNDPIGGRSLAEAAIEARIRFGNFGIVPFLDAGQLYTGTYPTFSGMRFGTGVGVRYYSSFGPIRVDVGTPLDRQSGESRVALYVSLGQAF